MEPIVGFFLLLAIMAFLFTTEIIPLAVTSLSGAGICWIAGYISIDYVILGMKNPTVLFFIGMYIIGAALLRTGVAQQIGHTIVKTCGTSENEIMFGLMISATLLSAVLSNTGTTAVLMPLALGISYSAKISPSRQLMPLAFACSWGGLLTLMGSPSNVIANSALKASHLSKFSFFEFAYIGIPLSVVGIIYMMLLGKKMLPKEERKNRFNNICPEDFESLNLKQIIPVVMLISIIIVMALDVRVIPLELAAILGATICLIFRCLTVKQAFRSVDWDAIFLFFGMICVAEAMNQTGASHFIAKMGVTWGNSSQNPLLVMIILFGISCSLTQFMPNIASTMLLCPIGIAIAQVLKINPNPFVMAIIVASTCSYATPIGSSSNIMILNYGHYSFKDYLKVGSGLVVISFLISVFLIPLIWPFF